MKVKKKAPIKKTTSTKKKTQTTQRRLTHVTLLLDETGSMSSIKDRTISGVNEYFDSLRKDQGDDVIVNFSKFDSRGIRVVHSGAKIKDVAPLNDKTYQPGHMTNLFDAIGKTIRESEKHNQKAHLKLFVVMTDGEENSSVEYTLSDVRRLVDEKTKEGWTFVFLGCNIDAYAQGSSTGIARGNTISATPDTLQKSYAATAQSTTSLRASGQATTSNFYDQNQKTRVEQKKNSQAPRSTT